MKKRVQFSAATWIALVVSLAFAGGASKAPFKPMKIEAFMKMRMQMQNPQSKGASMSRDMSMHVTMWIKSSDTMRMEMNMQGMMPGKVPGDSKIVTVADAGTVYILVPAQKTAAKFGSITDLAKMGGMGGMGNMLLDPSKVTWTTEDLKKMGLKKKGTAKIGKDRCEVYKGTIKAPQMGMSLTMWVRQSDRFPMKTEVKNPMMHVTTEVKNIIKNYRMTDAMFKVPPDYKIQEGFGKGKMGLPPPPAKVQ